MGWGALIKNASQDRTWFRMAPRRPHTSGKGRGGRKEGVDQSVGCVILCCGDPIIDVQATSTTGRVELVDPMMSVAWGSQATRPSTVAGRESRNGSRARRSELGGAALLNRAALTSCANSPLRVMNSIYRHHDDRGSLSLFPGDAACQASPLRDVPLACVG